MTSLLPAATSRRSASEVSADLTTRRPLVLIATFGGIAAAAATLLVCMAFGVIGWFLTDGGSHGAPRDGLRTGALAWLMGHGSGLRVEGVPITAVPLGITAVCAWAAWRIGQRVGSSISGHGPDSDAVVDGDRDFVVPFALTLFTAGYVVTAVVTASVAATPETAPSTLRVILWSLLLCALVAGPAIAVGSGRAAIWTSYLPATLGASAHAARRILVLWVAVSLVAFAVSLVLDFSTAANVMSQLHADTGAVVLITVLSLVLLPNAVAFSGSYLLGPGFTVGTGTLVTPGAVVLGPLPTFPMLAALPDEGQTPGWTPWLILLPLVVAFVAVVLCQRSWPTNRYDEGALRGCVGGVCAGIGFGVLAWLAGGAVGPGRMSDIAPFASEAMLHAVTSFGIGGLLGGLAITWWQRRTMPVAIHMNESVLEH